MKYFNKSNIAHAHNRIVKRECKGIRITTISAYNFCGFTGKKTRDEDKKQLTIKTESNGNDNNTFNTTVNEHKAHTVKLK